MQKSNFLDRFDFMTYILPRVFLNNAAIKCLDYAKNNCDQELKEFSRLFWEAPSKSIIELRKECNIKTSISFIDILVTYPVDKYYEYLFDYYIDGKSLNDLMLKYMINGNRSKALLIPLDLIRLDDIFCPRCFSNKFNIHILNDNVELGCCVCNMDIKQNMLSQSEMEEAKSHMLIEYNKYMAKMDVLRSRISSLHCPKCKAELQLLGILDDFEKYIIKNKQNHSIKCSNCSYMESDVDKIEQENKKQNNCEKILAAIKDKEIELIAMKLNSKKQCYFMNEEIITSNFSEIKLNEFIKKSTELNKEKPYRHQLASVLRNISRIERKVLVYIIDMIDETTERIGDDYIVFNKIAFNEPLVYDLIDNAGIIPIRKILKKLMLKHILFTNEEDNYIIITDFIAESVIRVRDYYDLNNVDDSHLKFVTIARQDYKCYICGENGKQLNLAYLSTRKTTTDLNDVIGICPDCFEYHTNCGVVVDAFILHDGLYNAGKCRSFSFFKHYLTDVLDSDWVESVLVDYEKRYGEKDVIKALSISIDAYFKEKLHSDREIIRYTSGVLRNAYTDGVNVNNNLYDRYDLSSWDI